MYPAQKIANWILQEAADNGIRLTQMQLQKLLYYAQGYNLGMTGECLFPDKIYAYEHGPVVKSMRPPYKSYGKELIPVPERTTIPDEVKGLIVSIIREKGRKTASQLRNTTHKEPPYDTTIRDEEITPKKMKEYFSSLFWNSDEEDDYLPSFDTIEEEKDFLRKSLSESDRKAILGCGSR